MDLLVKAAKLNENAEELSITDYIQAKAAYLEQEYNFMQATKGNFAFFEWQFDYNKDGQLTPDEVEMAKD